MPPEEVSRAKEARMIREGKNKVPENDPAGYLPNVIKKRRKRNLSSYNLGGNSNPTKASPSTMKEALVKRRVAEKMSPKRQGNGPTPFVSPRVKPDEEGFVPKKKGPVKYTSPRRLPDERGTFRRKK